MKIIFAILFMVFTLLLLSGCGKKLQPQITTNYKDSVVEKKTIVLKDTVIYTPGDEVYITDTMPCPEYDKKDSSKTGNVKIAVKIKGGKLTATCKQDSLQHRIKWLEEELVKEKYSSNVTTETKYITVEKPVKYIPKWVWWLLVYATALTAWQFRGNIAALLKHFITKWK